MSPTGEGNHDQEVVAASALAPFADDPEFVTSLARGLAVLLTLSDKRRGMSIAQVSHRTGIPRAAARRSLHTLVKLGFAATDAANRFYLRPRVLTFGHAYLSASPLAVLAQPILDRLGEALHEACSIAVLDGEEIVYLARSASSRVMSPSLNVGRRLPAYCTSIGQVLLAHVPNDELEHYLKHTRFDAYTAHTPNTAEKVRNVVARARECGYAIASQQMESRLCTLAVPVRDTSGRHVAGINVILQGRPVGADEMADRFLLPLQHAALELGSMLVP